MVSGQLKGLQMRYCNQIWCIAKFMKTPVGNAIGRPRSISELSLLKKVTAFQTIYYGYNWDIVIKFGEFQAYMKTPVDNAFGPLWSMSMSSFLKNIKMISGQWQELDIIICNQNWFIASLYEVPGWDYN
jgi:hypothetical protein